ncbi:MAG: BamA/TamA family outer membrane protein [Cryomorphaceae bacterium]|nr:BamA/TamA family outer membrane protein [Cryomorphaceae bacterium]
MLVIHRISLLFFLLMLFSGCNSLKYVPEEKDLLDGYELKWQPSDYEHRRAVMGEMEESVRPNPNEMLLGMRPGLWARYRTEAEKGRWLTKYLNKRYGQKPVYVTDVNLDRIRTILVNRLENNGLFFSDIHFELKRTGKKTKKLVISIQTSAPYRLNNYTLDIPDENENLQKMLQVAVQNTTIKPGDVFRLSALKVETNRIQDELREQGFYYFHSDHLIFEMDTVNNNNPRTFDLFLRLKPETSERAKVPYQIGQINVFTNYSQSDTGNISVKYRDIYFDRDDFFYPKHLRNLVLFEPGATFRLHDQRRTSRYLNSLRTYTHANLRFSQNDSNPQLLDLGIYLSPASRRSFRAELQAVTRSNNFAGPAARLTYTNRNIFKGGETFRLSTNFSFETQLGDGFDGAYSYEFGVMGELDIPRLLFRPKLSKYASYNLPKTKISTGVNFLRRAGFYTLNNFSARYGYLWQSSARITHDIEALDIMYSNLLSTTGEFEAVLNANPFLRRSFERQFIPAISYSFTYSELSENKRSVRKFLMLHAESSGNLLGGGYAIFNADPELLGLPFAQFVKGELDLRLNAKAGKDRNLVGRIFTGYGYAYGNSQSLPFVKQYFAGGPNSVRAFRIRSLGPGGYINPDPTRIGAFFDQSGDIRLEANLEYRFPLVSLLKGAWFLDVGNVWLLRDNPALPNGAFSNDWFNQLAMGGGFGLRVDVNFFVLRFDFATPIRLHASDDNVWVIQNFNPLERAWYRDGLMVNFALGYPF